VSFSTFVARAARPAAAVAATGFILIASFELCLALGSSWGHAAWGGGDGDLSLGLRLASALSAVVLATAALVVLGRAGLWASAVPFGVFRWGTWALVAAMTLSALANFASSSTWERFLMGPIALLLALLGLVVTRGGRRDTAEVTGAQTGTQITRDGAKT
jgi:hypothetical protein